MVEVSETELNHMYGAINELSPVPQQEWEDISSIFRKKAYAKNDYLIREGESGNDWFFILRGLVLVFYTTLQGKEYNKSFRW